MGNALCRMGCTRRASTAGQNRSRKAEIIACEKQERENNSDNDAERNNRRRVPEGERQRQNRHREEPKKRTLQQHCDKTTVTEHTSFSSAERPRSVEPRMRSCFATTVANERRFIYGVHVQKRRKNEKKTEVHPKQNRDSRTVSFGTKNIKPECTHSV